MADFTVRSDNVDVEQIMRQIRMRIKEKRGVDYTEDEVRELANVKLEKFLNPRVIRSELVEHYRRQRVTTPLSAGPPPPDNYAFEAETIYESHRGPLQWMRKLLNPILKLFFNPNPVIHVLNRQGKMNAYLLQQLDHVSERFVTRDELDALNFEVLNNIVLELTRTSIEVKNLRMQIESMTARQEFNERRARAVEGMLVPGAAPSGVSSPGGLPNVAKESGGAEDDAEGRTKRRRRRRGRRRPDGDSAGGEARSANGAAGSESGDTRSAPGEADAASESPPRSEPGTGQ